VITKKTMGIKPHSFGANRVLLGAYKPDLMVVTSQRSIIEMISHMGLVKA
jgi:hypothetical protein